MSLTPVEVRIQVPVRSGDGAGGKTIAWSTQQIAARPAVRAVRRRAPLVGSSTGPAFTSSAMATINFYGRTSQLLRMEQAAHNAQGPGVATRTQRLFVFEPPFPVIQANYRLITPDGSAFVVQFVREYETTMQVDAELVG